MNNLTISKILINILIKINKNQKLLIVTIKNLKMLNKGQNLNSNFRSLLILILAQGKKAIINKIYLLLIITPKLKQNNKFNHKVEKMKLMLINKLNA